MDTLTEQQKNYLEQLPSIPLSIHMKNLTNKKQGQLTFIKPSKKEGYRTFWWVICDCGKIEEIRSDSKKQSCIECAHKRAGETNKGKKALNLTNQKFGKLTAKFMQPKRQNGHIVWHCQCECGNEIDVISSSLTSNNTQSCGCLKKENAHFVQYKENLVGQKFGKLTVLEETNKREYEKVVWKCQCDCGNIIYLNTGRLKNKNDISCGCLKQSYGVTNIINILNKNNIKYIKEYHFTDLPNRFYDFAIFNKNNELIRLIEFDGEQHFRITGGWNNKQHFIENQQRDKEKNNWAKEHNIPLVRIPYWERDNITLDMIMGDKYLIK